MNNQNNIYNWPSRLLQYDVVPNRKTNKEEGWEKLRQRLDAKRRKKKLSLYWTAAAAVVPFMLLIFIHTPVRNISVAPGLTKRPAIFNKENGTLPSTDSCLPALHPAMNYTKSMAKETEINTDISKRPVPDKKPILLPSIPDSAPPPANDTIVTTDQLVNQSQPLPKIHINDIITQEPLPPNTTIKTLTVKKMIRMFNTDFTGGESSKKQEAIPQSQYSIPNNQN